MRLQGTGVSHGCALGPVHRVTRTVDEPSVAPRPSDSETGPELERFHAAAAAVADSQEAAARTAQSTARDVLEATAEMAADPALLAIANRHIQDGRLTAERATWEATGELRARLEAVGGYLGERAADIDDIRDRIIAALRGGPLGITLPTTPSILVGETLSPTDTAGLDPDTVLAIVTTNGGAQSHSAILARTLGIPAVVGADAHVVDIDDGTQLFVDGSTGVLSDDPTEDERDRAVQFSAERSAAPVLTSHGELACGTRIPLLANVGSATEAKAAAESGAEGIGLLRTEFLFLDREDEPTVVEQTEVYAEIFSHFPGLPVTVRTLDAGSDKPIPFIWGSRDEPNPALGMRGFRTHSFAPEVLERQIEAIARAAKSATAEVKVMAPMITTPKEAVRFAALVRAAGLDSAGVMIETPAAALCAESVLEPVAFASIGTNDLAQYTLAFDRELNDYEELQSARQPAILRLIDAVIVGARRADDGDARAGDESRAEARANPRPVSVCGEAAADPELAVVLVGLGVSTLSMSAPALPRVAARLAEVTLEQARESALQALDGTLWTDDGANAMASDIEPEAGTGTGTGTGTEAIRRTIHVTAPTGLHARPAALLARAVKALDAEITLRRPGNEATASATSVMDIMGLGIDPGHDVEVSASGPDAAAAVAAVEAAATGEA
ncbi:HPr family phosphocarrier protein [Brevibacterium zhoupengii]|uniref:HPr family phosphocarrier protein n=1 Tax=Brevibacterium zhoupengii TaxID=2898795 RepID=UPI001E2EB9DB|nr:HPr family phosphocarrier protein [Brevibacterium zhoupengii]